MDINDRIKTQKLLVQHVLNMSRWQGEFMLDGLYGDGCSPLPKLSYVELGLSIETCANLKLKHKELEEALDKARDIAPEEGAGAYRNVIQIYNVYIEMVLTAFDLHEVEIIQNEDIKSVSEDQMANQIKREMSRLERNNTVFCLANLAIDQPEYKDDAEIQRLLNEKVINILRTFDDAYYLGSTETVLCLKDIDLLDATSVLERLCKEVLETDFNGKSITLSCGVTEPVEGDKTEVLLRGIRAERENARRNGGNTVSEHMEKSPLARLAQDGEKD